MITIFITAFVLGAIFNIAPGAIFAESLRRGARGGYWPALYVQLGSLFGDAIWAILGLLGIGLLLQADMLRLPVGIAGGTYLLYLAYDSWRAATEDDGTDYTDDTAPILAGLETRSAVRSGVILSVTNPQNIAYWAALGSAFGTLGIANPTAVDYGIFFAGFMASSIAWCFVCAALIARLFRGRTKAWKIWTYRLCAVAFLYLGGGTLWDAVAPFIG